MSTQADTQADDTTKVAAPDAETRIASFAQAPPPQTFSPASEPAPIAAEPAAPAQPSTQDSPEIDALTMKIATLGSVPVPTKRPPATANSKKIDEAAVKKRLQARKAAQRRRLAARARLAAQQTQQPLPPAQQLAPPAQHLTPPAQHLTPPAQQQAFTPFDQPSAPATARR
jgi:hypothetical protein